MTIYILVLPRTEILQSFKKIDLILAVHQIDGPLREGPSKFFIVREAGALFLRQQRILELFDIVVLRAVVPDDFPVQQEKDFIQNIRRKIAHGPAEQIILRGQEYLRNLWKRQLIFVIQTQHFKKKRPRHRRLQPVQPKDARIQRSASGMAVKQHLIAFRVGEHLGKQRLCLPLSKFHELLKIRIDFFLLRDRLLLHTQIIPDKGCDIVLRADLDLIPVLFVIFFLFPGQQPHQDKVPDLVPFT